MNQRTFSFIFFTLLAVEISVLVFAPAYRFLSKPLIMISLIAYFGFQIGGKPKAHLLILMGLIFALLGDILLLNNGISFFKLGILSFMITHIFYMIDFLKQRSLGIHKHLPFILLFSIIPIFFNYFFWDHLDSLAIPVLIYSFVISAAVIAAKMRWKLKGYWHILIGIILFVISDFSIAFQKFYFAFDYADILIMVTYAVAQYLIVQGYLLGKNLLK